MKFVDSNLEIGNLNIIYGGLLHRFEKYSIETINDKQYIVGKNISKDFQTDIQDDLFTGDKTRKSKLATSLGNVFILNKPINYDDPINSIDNNKLIAFLKVYGLPELDIVLLNNDVYAIDLNLFFRKGILLSLFFQLQHDCLYEDERSINTYFHAFISNPLFKAIDKSLTIDSWMLNLLDNSKETRNKYYSDLQNEFTKKNIKKNMFEFKNSNWKRRLEKLTHLFSTAINTELNEMKFSFYASTSQFTLEATNLFQVIMYERAILISKMNVEGKSNIKTCANPNCLAIFNGHGNKKYCNNCDRRTMWSRKNKK